MQKTATVLSPIIIIIILLAGCNVNTDFEHKTVKKSKEVAKNYLIHNYEGIKDVTFEEDISNPMGGLMIRGKVNQSAAFSISMDEKKFTMESIGEGEHFPKLKEECMKKECPY